MRLLQRESVFALIEASFRKGDGAAQGSAELTVELDGQPHTAGVTVSHPLLLEEQGSREGDT